MIVEHPAGSRDENDRQKVYLRNCGYVQQALEEQNEWQDACILACTEPLEWFEGEVKAEVEVGGRTIWAVAPEERSVSQEEARSELAFLGKIQKMIMF